jgi:hypothetical protein
VATLQELVPYDYGSTEEMWKRIPSYLRYADTTGVDADPEQLGRGQFQRFINIFGFEMDRTRTLINAVFTGYDPSLTESTSLDKLTSMLGLELTSKDIGISRIRQIIQDVGYYRLRKGTLNAASQYITAVSGCQVDVIENPTDPQYTFRVYAEKVNLVADSLFVIESGTKKWDFNSSSASCDYSKSGKVITKITTEDLRNKPGQSIATILNTVAGVEINGSQSAAGKNLGYYLRGGKNSQVLILIDGIPVNDASGISMEYDLQFS